jgi:predicted DNA-binding protein (MmcQ/YjbR family)
MMNPTGHRTLWQVCLTLGEVVEKEAWGECTFRAIGGSMFAMTDNNHQSGHQAIWIKAPAMVQEILINSDPGKFFKPAHLGPKGWVGVRLNDSSDWDELAALLTNGYRLSARKQKSRRRQP